MLSTESKAHNDATL